MISRLITDLELLNNDLYSHMIHMSISVRVWSCDSKKTGKLNQGETLIEAQPKKK